ncbi:MAG: EamA family transporter [Candidatus Lokiarchaeota archaeon]|nr:EamA family transporter [Candidatus Lokiarchaeota archaeon]
MTVEDMDKAQVNPIVSKISMFLSGIFMGNVGIFISLLSGYPVYSIVLFRGIFGAAFLLLFILITRSFSFTFFKECFKLHWKYLIILAVSNPIVVLLYFLNITLTGYAFAAFLLYTSGVFLLLFLVITKTEKVSKINIISFILAIAGISIIMEFWTGQILILGIVIGILSGFCLGILIFSKKKIYKARENLNSKAKGNFDAFLTLWSTLFLIFPFLPLGITDLFKITFLDFTIILLLGLIPTALAFTLYNVGVKKDKGGNIVILSYFEPVMATINTAIFLQNLSIFTIIGGFFVLAANYITLKYVK